MDQKVNFPRDTNAPLYQQLKEALLSELKTLSPLSPIPSERELCEKFGVSRPTVRRALDELEQEGELYRLPGKGTFVAEKDKKYVDHELQWSIGFHEDAKMQRKNPSTKVLQQTISQANAMIAKKLSIPEGTDIFVLERLRFIDNEAICLVASYIPLHICPELPKANFAEQSLYKFLESFNITIFKAKRSIEIKKASITEATYLDIEKESPVFLFESLGFTEGGTPLEYVVSRYPGYKARFESEVYQPHSSNNGFTLLE